MSCAYCPLTAPSSAQAGMRLLYTGDYSRIPDRHMPAADLPDQRPHIVIVEST